MIESLGSVMLSRPFLCILGRKCDICATMSIFLRNFVAVKSSCLTILLCQI